VKSHDRNALTRIKASGIEPVGISLASPDWKEAFLHPRDAHGIVIQVAQQGLAPLSPPPAELPQPGPPARFDLIEHHVSDLDGAVRLLRDALDGRLEGDGAGTAELTWPGGKRIKLVRADGLPLGGALHHIRFTRTAAAFSARDRERAGLLASHLGVGVGLGDGPAADRDHSPGSHLRRNNITRSPPELPLLVYIGDCQICTTLLMVP